MAYTRATTSRNYYGLSSERKPYIGTQSDGTSLTATELPKGTTATELDTGIVFTFDGREWIIVPMPPREDLAAKFDEMQSTLTKMNETLEAILLVLAGG